MISGKNDGGSRERNSNNRGDWFIEERVVLKERFPRTRVMD